MAKSISHPDYPVFLADLKARILHARTSAARAVNRELILLYWDIGRGIVQKQQVAGWGDAVVERLASDLRAEFPDMRGFSVANLWRMKQFYLVHTSPEFLAQAAREMKKTRGQFLPQTAAKLQIEGADLEKLAQAVRELARLSDGANHSEVKKKLLS